MNITLSKLKQLIKEELQATSLSENKAAADEIRSKMTPLLKDLENQDKMMYSPGRDDIIRRIENFAEAIHTYAYAHTDGESRNTLIGDPKDNEVGIVGIVPYLFRKAEEMKKANVLDQKFADHANAIANNVRKKLGNLAAVKEEKKSVQHKWMKEGRLSSDLQERYGISEENAVGKVLWHSLNESGEIGHYDMKFGNTIVRGLLIENIEPSIVKEHSHKPSE